MGGVDTTHASNTLTSADLNTWLDHLVPAALAHDAVAGAVIVVVKDGKVLSERGYGYADVATRRAVDPGATLFRVASISKLFTWTAVMQQVELGKLDLDADINSYLDFPIPPAWPKPITLRNLMTHTAGFEETNKNTYAPDAASMPALGSLLKSWVPERIYPPGEVVAYSNYGAALAGYIVERVSHERYEDYVAHHILAPLRMQHSTFVQPPPAALADNLSKGYVLPSDAPSAFEFEELRPAGGLSATGADMARFMIAHLQDGAFGDSRILKNETAIAMHSEAWQADPELPGMALGFWHLDRNGHVIIAHTGDTVVFHSSLYLILDAHVGLFVATNSAGGEDLQRDVFNAFVDRYFHASQPEPAPTPTLGSALADARQIAGTYENSRRADSSFMIAEEIFNERTIRVNPDATISLSGSVDANGHLRKWREVAPLRWREVDGMHRLDAIRHNGQVTAIATNTGAPIAVLMPASFWRSATWNVPLFLATLGILVLTVVCWPVAALLRRLFRKPLALAGSAAIAYRLTFIVVMADLIFLCGWSEFLRYTDDHVAAMDSRIDWLLRLLQALGTAGTIGTLAPIYLLAHALRNPSLRWWTKGSAALVAIACTATVWFTFSLNLLSWTLNY
jgi:CubicO group peptidase (beta-lactamase class C family)